jgi:hypothetical protein
MKRSETTVLNPNKVTIGRFEYVWLVTAGQKKIPARIDTGARTTAIWASQIVEQNGELTWYFFGQDSPFYTGQKMKTRHYRHRVVANSTGHREVRYLIPITIQIKGRRVSSRCTLADRSKQTFPVLIGRNTLSGKFVVDVHHGSRKLSELDKQRYDELQKMKGVKR